VKHGYATPGCKQAGLAASRVKSPSVRVLPIAPKTNFIVARFDAPKQVRLSSSYEPPRHQDTKQSWKIKDQVAGRVFSVFLIPAFLGVLVSWW
jgi:hypothetical protein